MAAICDLPIEMRLEILEKLDLHELVVNSSKTCHQWRDDIAQHTRIMFYKERSIKNDCHDLSNFEKNQRTD